MTEDDIVKDVTCPACGSPMRNGVYRDSVFGREMDVTVCTNPECEYS